MHLSRTCTNLGSSLAKLAAAGAVLAFASSAMAFTSSPNCSAANPNNCGIPSGTPGCNDVACCKLVCGLDPNCCSVAWDANCVATASAVCSGICAPGGPANDCCANATVANTGVNNMSNVGAGEDGLDHPGCLFFGDQGIPADVWYKWTATFTGNAIISTCNTSGTWDTKIAVYSENCATPVCPPTSAQLIGCVDDTAGCANFSTIVTVPVTMGNCYRIRIGSYPLDTPPTQGSGTFSITQGAAPCSLTCPPGSLLEGEPCLGTDATDNTNGGCNSTPNVFTAVPVAAGAYNVTYCGTGSTYTFSGSNRRDTDWYRVTLGAAQDPDGNGLVALTGILRSEFQCGVFIARILSPCAATVLATAWSDNCSLVQSCSANIPVPVPAGTSYVVIALPATSAGGVFTGIPCGGAIGNDYQLTITTSNVCGPPPVCGSFNPNPCNTVSSAPGCSDAACCSTVCALDAFCCGTAWDADCVSLASVVCSAPCSITCSGTPEGEACAASTNGGCNSTPDAPQVITAGTTICGTIWADNGTRDTDWFQLNGVPANSKICATIVSEIPATVLFAGATCPAAIITGSIAADSGACQTSNNVGEAAITTAGSYRVIVVTGTVATAIFNGYPCGGPNGNDYSLTVNVVTPSTAACPTATPCVGDLNNDGTVGPADLGILLGSWGNPGCGGSSPCPADINGDGAVGPADLGALLGNWGPC